MLYEQENKREDRGILLDGNSQAAAAWMKKAGGDPDLAYRMYRKAEILEELGPIRRP